MEGGGGLLIFFMCNRTGTVVGKKAEPKGRNIGQMQADLTVRQYFRVAEHGRRQTVEMRPCPTEQPQGYRFVCSLEATAFGNLYCFKRGRYELVSAPFALPSFLFIAASSF